MDEHPTIADLERRLTESETRHRLLTESWAQAEWETDADGVVVVDSSSWRAYTGQTPDEWLGHGWLDAIHHDDRAYAERQWREAIAARRLVNAEFRLRAPDGGWRWTNVRAAPLLDTGGRIEKWVGINIDINAGKEAESALRQSEEKYRTLFETMSQGFAECEMVRDAEGRALDVRYIELNPSWERLTGLPVADVRGRTAREVVPDLEDWWIEMYDRVVTSGTPERIEHEAAPLGRCYEVQVYPGSGNRFSVLYDDITERKKAELALRESEEKYRTLFETMGQGYCEYDILRDQTGRAIDMRLLEANPQWEALTGFSRTRMQGRLVSEFLPDLEPSWTETLDRVVRTGEPRRFENEVAALGVWYEVYAYPRGSDRFALLYDDISERKRSEAALRESEERQAFLLKLSDTLRPLADAVEITRAASEELGRHLNVGRCAYCEVDEFGDYFTVERDWTDGVMPSFVGRHFFGFGDQFLEDYRAGKSVVIDDAMEDARAAGGEAAFEAAGGVRAAIGVPLIKGGRFAAGFFVQQREPRHWSAQDEALTREVAERTWAAVERARAEARLRESEARFAQFAKASAAGLWIRKAETLAMEFVSPAISAIYGVEPDALLGDVERWAALIVPEDRDTAFAHLEAARRGEVAVHEFRIQRPSDGVFRWIRNTDFPLHDDGHIQRVGGIAEDVTEAKLAAEHSAVLLAELQHRVRNIMALLRSITNRTGDRAESVPEYRDLMMGRLLAFARVQALLTRSANVSVGIASIVHDEVSVQAQHEGQYVLEGPDVALSPKAAEVLTLAIHELVTNAVKYGALSVPTGRVTVRWSTFEKRGGLWLAFDWTEEGVPARPTPMLEAPRRRGFGSELIEQRIPYELRGRGQVTIEPGGARCHLEFPLQGGASILETGAPLRANVFGGAIDMTGEPDLTGRRVLVVEDDFYLATDAARALRGAGAEIMGPCATEEDARAELEEQRPDAVVVDINLGPGPSFKLAETLKDRGILFVFTTGYDAEVIPIEFAGVERLEKPFQLRQIVGAVARLTLEVT